MRSETVLKTAVFAFEDDIPAPVELPHTWNALDGEDGGGDYRRGRGVYRIPLPDPTEGKRQYIQFEGANHVARVFCNGLEAGEHRGGFSAFRFELTDLMKPSGNELTAQVYNGVCDVYPQHADFTFFGGLYRNVTFIETGSAGFDLMKDGSCGVFVTARACGKTRIDAFTFGAEGCTVSAELRDASGETAAAASVPALEHTAIVLDVPRPRLWNGTEDPYLYTAELRLIKGGVTEDAVTVRYGYRSLRADPERGFFLNGRSRPLRGVARHQDRPGKGWALSREDHREDMELIKEIGANAVRLAHYQHDRYFYDLCDEAGMAVWAEIPFITVFRSGEAARENTLSQLRELIAQNYNHPSIFVWGISNEISFAGESEELFQNLCALNALAKKLDPGRLTAMAQGSALPMDSEHMFITDVIGYNRYLGWYEGRTRDFGEWADRFHELNPDRPLAISEYGADAPLEWHSEKPENHDYTEEYQALYHREMLDMIEERPYLWASFVWNMFDFAADFRDEGGCRGINTKGLVTRDRKTRKDSFYIYKARWTREPMVHICGRRFVNRAPGQRDVTVFTNCPRVELYLNGLPAGTGTPRGCVCTFEDVPLLPGENAVEARCGTEAEDSVTLTGVTEPDPRYVMPPRKGPAGNWFDREDAARRPASPEGRCSVYDTVGELLGNPGAGPLLTGMMKKIAEKNGAGDRAAGILKAMSGRRLLDFMKMLSKQEHGITDETVLRLNEQLNRFEK